MSRSCSAGAAQCAALDELVASVRAGPSRALVLRGEAGVGKSALLEYLVRRASGCAVALGALLEAHPRLLGMDELDAQLAHVLRSRDALRVLTDDGLATRLGDRVGVSRAAVRFHALAPL